MYEGRERARASINHVKTLLHIVRRERFRSLRPALTAQVHLARVYAYNDHYPSPCRTLGRQHLGARTVGTRRVQGQPMRHSVRLLFDEFATVNVAMSVSPFWQEFRRFTDIVDESTVCLC